MPKDPYKTFLTALKFENKSAETIRTYDKCLRKYRDYLKETKQEVGEDSMMGFLEEMSEKEQLKPTTIKLYMIILKRYFKFIGEDFPRVKFPRIPKNRPKFLEREDLKRLYDMTEDWYPLRAILSTGYSAAMRIGEVTTRRFKDLTIKEEVVVDKKGVTSVKKVGSIFVSGKTGPESDATIPLMESAVEDIEAWIALRKEEGLPDLKPDDYLFHRPDDVSKPYAKSTLNSQLFTLCEKAGLEHRSFHKLRHSRATHLREDGVELINIKDQLRHKSIITTMGYASTDTEKLRKAVGDKDVLSKGK